MQEYHRPDLSDEAWKRLEEKLLGRRGTWGGIAQDNRRFCRWRDKWFWKKLLETLSEEPELRSLKRIANRLNS